MQLRAHPHLITLNLQLRPISVGILSDEVQPKDAEVMQYYLVLFS
jgi:hypothetical protein